MIRTAETLMGADRPAVLDEEQNLVKSRLKLSRAVRREEKYLRNVH